jgi:hypothetical protein
MNKQTPRHGSAVSLPTPAELDAIRTFQAQFAPWSVTAARYRQEQAKAPAANDRR